MTMIHTIQSAVRGGRHARWQSSAPFPMAAATAAETSFSAA